MAEFIYFPSLRFQDFVKLLKSEFGVSLADAIDALMLPPSVQDARTLHEAMKVSCGCKVYFVSFHNTTRRS